MAQTPNADVIEVKSNLADDEESSTDPDMPGLTSGSEAESFNDQKTWDKVTVMLVLCECFTDTIITRLYCTIDNRNNL